VSHLVALMLQRTKKTFNLVGDTAKWLKVKWQKLYFFNINHRHQF